MPSGTPVRVRWGAVFLGLCFLFVCMMFICKSSFWAESPGGTPYLFPALRALGPSALIAFWCPLGSPWTPLGSPWTPFWSTWGPLGRFFYPPGVALDSLFRFWGWLERHCFIICACFLHYLFEPCFFMNFQCIFLDLWCPDHLQDHVFTADVS